MTWYIDTVLTIYVASNEYCGAKFSGHQVGRKPLYLYVAKFLSSTLADIAVYASLHK